MADFLTWLSLLTALGGCWVLGYKMGARNAAIRIGQTVALVPVPVKEG